MSKIKKLYCNSKFMFTGVKKYSYTYSGERIEYNQIIAIKNFDCIKAGTIGGFISDPSQINEFDNSWVGKGVRLEGTTYVTGDSYIINNEKSFDLIIENSLINKTIITSNKGGEIVDSKIKNSNIKFSNYKEMEEMDINSSTIIDSSLYGFTINNCKCSDSLLIYYKSFDKEDEIVYNNKNIKNDKYDARKSKRHRYYTQEYYKFM